MATSESPRIIGGIFIVKAQKMLYTTVDKLKKHLDIVGDGEDVALGELIETATALVDVELGDNLGKATFTRRVDGSGTPRIVMENRVNSVEYVKVWRGGSSYECPVAFIDGSVVHLDRETQRGEANVEIRYERGYDNVPKDFEAYFLAYCKELYESGKGSDDDRIKSKKMGEIAITFFSPSEIASDVLVKMRPILDKYRNFTSFAV